jgi:Putative adhesin
MRLEKVIRHSFPASSGSLFALDADKGAIRIGPGEGNQIQVDASLVARAGSEAEAQAMLERVVIEFLEAESGPSVHSRAAAAERSAWGFWRRQGKVELTFSIAIPCLQDLLVENGAGEIEVGRVQGNVRLRTRAGTIRVHAIRGAVYAQTESGCLEIGQVEERVVARSTSGDIALRQIGCALEVTTGAGSVSAQIVGQPRADSEITTKAGNVSIDLADTAGLYLDAAAQVGRVTVRIPSMASSSGGLGGALRSEVNGGGPRLTVRTAVGQVSIQSFSPSL